MPSVQQELVAFLEQDELYVVEGRQGAGNLCKLVEVLGYKDPQHFGQLSNGACLGSLLAFLEDNSGAIAAIQVWIGKQAVPEWREALQSQTIPPTE